MKLGPKVVDKSAFVAIYLIVAVLVVWGAGGLVNYAIDFGFYRDFLQPWETGMLETRHKSVRWPADTPDNPVAYMQSVTEVMKANGIQMPNSNTERPFVYRLNRFGEGATKILLVSNGNRIIIYGLPSSTFERLDRFIDGHPDEGQGDFTGQLSKDNITMIGNWKV